MIPETDSGLTTLAHRVAQDFPIILGPANDPLLNAAHACVSEARDRFLETALTVSRTKSVLDETSLEAEACGIQLRDQVRDAWRQFKRADRRGYGKKTVYLVTKSPRTFLPRNNNVRDWRHCATLLLHGLRLTKDFGLRIPIQEDLLRRFAEMSSQLMLTKGDAEREKKEAVKARQLARTKLQNALKTMRYAIETYYSHLSLEEVNRNVRDLGFPLKSLTEKRRKRRKEQQIDQQPLALEAPKKQAEPQETASAMTPNTVDAEVVATETVASDGKAQKTRAAKPKKSPQERAALRRKLRKRRLLAQCEEPGNAITGCFMDPPSDIDDDRYKNWRPKVSRLPD